MLEVLQRKRLLYFALMTVGNRSSLLGVPNVTNLHAVQDNYKPNIFGKM